MGMIVYAFSFLTFFGGTSPITNNTLENFTASTLCADDDYIALRELYLHTDGDNWADRTGWEDAAFFNANPTRPAGLDVNTWYGVNMNPNGCVTELLLFSNNLNGIIPPEIGLMSNLVSLHLYNNQLSGTIPSEIGNLMELESLRLNTNQLSGNIPAEIGDLINLVTLRLYNNQLSGCYDENLSNLCTQLEAISNTNNVISNGNTFDAAWEDFCNSSTGECVCTTSLFLTGVLPSNTYQASNDITSDGTVATGSNVQFKAGQCILLGNDFSVQSNADFSADIEDCNQ